MLRYLSRRRLLVSALALGAPAILAACGGTAPASPTAGSAAAPAATKPAEALAAKIEATRDRPPPRRWRRCRARRHDRTEDLVPLGGATGDRAQELINKYNTTKGPEDKIHVTIETVRDQEYRQKMTAARLASTTPDVYHTAVPIKELMKNEIVAELPTEEAGYVKTNYARGAVERMTVEGKLWGYPTEFQAPAFIYRKSYFQQAGVQPPKTTQEARELARKVTKTEGGKKTRYGFTHGTTTTRPPRIAA
jgi:ABC-type glycerol-3-phosphate transport system substrate-binding protein